MSSDIFVRKIRHYFKTLANQHETRKSANPACWALSPFRFKKCFVLSASANSLRQVILEFQGHRSEARMQERSICFIAPGFYESLQDLYFKHLGNVFLARKLHLSHTTKLQRNSKNHPNHLWKSAHRIHQVVLNKHNKPLRQTNWFLDVFGARAKGSVAQVLSVSLHWPSGRVLSGEAWKPGLFW